ncbi:MAG: macrocin O-methyltransferase [Candidatus Omnitrophica bacterium]|nr:macrocin O-methyltransferase [Candidatus Omnitrophota bacterium]
MKAWIKALIKKILRKFGYQIKRIYKGPGFIYLEEEDKIFNGAFKQIKEFTVIDKSRCFMIYQLAKHASNLRGDVAEVGVYKGGTARLLATTFDLKIKNLHLFDTFTGMPPIDAKRDTHREGDFNDCSLENVKAYLSDYKNVHFYRGIFPATVKPIENSTFCLVHVDVDIYKSVMDCCIFFYPRMEKGGLMIFDDYTSSTCPGVRAAVDEFFSDKPERPCSLSTGQSFVIRL